MDLNTQACISTSTVGGKEMQHKLCIYLMMWHGKVRTEWRTLSAAPLNLGSGLSRETPALDSFLSDK